MAFFFASKFFPKRKLYCLFFFLCIVYFHNDPNGNTIWMVLRHFYKRNVAKNNKKRVYYLHVCMHMTHSIVLFAFNDEGLAQFVCTQPFSTHSDWHSYKVNKKNRTHTHIPSATKHILRICAPCTNRAFSYFLRVIWLLMVHSKKIYWDLGFFFCSAWYTILYGTNHFWRYKERTARIMMVTMGLQRLTFLFMVKVAWI